MNDAKRWFQQAGWRLAGITLLALTLRFFRLDFRSLWLDEAYSLHLASAAWSGIISGAVKDIHPPLFHILLAGWILLFGTSEFALRSLSAIFGAGLVPVAFFLAKSWDTEKTGWWTACLVAGSPYFIEISRMGRMPALLAWFSLLSLYFYWQILQKEHVGWAAGYLVFTVAALYTHYFAFLILLSQQIFLFVGIGKLHLTRQQRTRWAFLQLLVLAGFLPWIPTFFTHLQLGGPAWRGLGASWFEPCHSIYIFLLSTTCWSLANKLAAGTFLAGAAASGIWCWKFIGRNFWETFNGRAWGLGITVLLISLAVVWIYSQNKLNVFDNRYLSGSAFVCLFALGAGLSRMPKISQRLAGLAIGLAFLIPLFNQYFVYGYYDNWRAVSAALPAKAQTREVVAIYPAWNEAPLAYYVRDRIPIQGLPGHYDSISGETQGYFTIDQDSVHQLQSFFVDHPRVWLILVNSGETQQIIWNWFASSCVVQQDHRVGGIRMTLFERPAVP